MQLVGFTYQDYLTYQKYLKKENKKVKKRSHEESEDFTDMVANILIKLEELENQREKQDKTTDDMVMEDEEKYEILEADQETNQRNIKEHDKLFRDLLNNKEEFVNFITNFIDKDINISEKNVEKYNRSFITNDYKSRMSDVVYKLKDKNIYFLIEHQSIIDYSMPFRMLEYCCEIMRDVVDRAKIKTKEYKLPKIVPIVLYTGNKKWKVPLCIEDIVYWNLRKIGITLTYLIIDTSRYSKERLLNSNSLIGYTMQLEKSKTNSEISEVVEKMITSKAHKAEEAERVIRYTLHDRMEQDEIDDIIGKFKQGKVGVGMITLRDRLAEYDKKLIAQGVAQGMEQGLKAIAKRMLDMKMQETDIQEATGLTKEQIAELKEIH